MVFNKLKLVQEVQCPRRDAYRKRSYRRRTSIRRSRLRSAKNFNRRLRRKRSLTRYYDHLKERRYTRKAEELCSSVSLFEIGDMEIDNDVFTNKAFTFIDPMTEVNEWHKHEQVAYWKSRAMALEYENKMLHEHLRDVYAAYIKNGADVSERETTKNGHIKHAGPILMKQKRERDTSVMSDTAVNAGAPKEADSEEEKAGEPLVSKKAAGEERRKEMSELYGEMSPQVMGMETAVQVNYDHHMEEFSIPQWPVLPLTMKFDG